ncbi:MAG TPA: hypothetical protein VFR62_10060 [Gemmatimonadales bacterium]|nr:hypothetical protein [Gemmatimonadales bacterium]
MGRAVTEEEAESYSLPRRLPSRPTAPLDEAAEFEDFPWRGNETPEAEMRRGPSFMRKVVSFTSEPAQGGLIKKMTYTLDDGHTVERFLINSAKPHTQASCDVCKGKP